MSGSEGNAPVCQLVGFDAQRAQAPSKRLGDVEICYTHVRYLSIYVTISTLYSFIFIDCTTVITRVTIPYFMDLLLPPHLSV